jgi:hypothetical protein
VAVCGRHGCCQAGHEANNSRFSNEDTCYITPTSVAVRTVCSRKVETEKASTEPESQDSPSGWLELCWVAATFKCNGRPPRRNANLGFAFLMQFGIASNRNQVVEGDSDPSEVHVFFEEVEAHHIQNSETLSECHRRVDGLNAKGNMSQYWARAVHRLAQRISSKMATLEMSISNVLATWRA